MRKFHQQSLNFIFEETEDLILGRIEEMPQLPPVVGNNINLVRYQLCIRLAHASHLWPDADEATERHPDEKPHAPTVEYQSTR